MGQYWKVVNLDKREYVHPHKLGCGLKLWEQLANSPGTGGALVILCAAMPAPRGGGDFDLDRNRHGPERDVNYHAIAGRTIGRWAGDRIALVGDYAQDSDCPGFPEFSKVYGRCSECGPDCKEIEGYPACRFDPTWHFQDITGDVAAVMEHELRGHFAGDGWRQWVSTPRPASQKAGTNGN